MTSLSCVFTLIKSHLNYNVDTLIRIKLQIMYDRLTTDLAQLGPSGSPARLSSYRLINYKIYGIKSICVDETIIGIRLQKVENERI